MKRLLLLAAMAGVAGYVCGRRRGVRPARVTVEPVVWDHGDDVAIKEATSILRKYIVPGKGCAMKFVKPGRPWGRA
jgi:hypothetical protein